MNKTFLTKTALAITLLLATHATPALHAMQPQAGPKIEAGVAQIKKSSGRFTDAVEKPQSKITQTYGWVAYAKALFVGTMGLAAGCLIGAAAGSEPVTAGLGCLGLFGSMGLFWDNEVSPVVKSYNTARATFDEIASRFENNLLLDLPENTRTKFRARLFSGAQDYPVKNSIALLNDYASSLKGAIISARWAQQQQSTSEAEKNVCRELIECSSKLLTRIADIIEKFELSESYRRECERLEKRSALTQQELDRQAAANAGKVAYKAMATYNNNPREVAVQ